MFTPRGARRREDTARNRPRPTGVGPSRSLTSEGIQVPRISMRESRRPGRTAVLVWCNRAVTPRTIRPPEETGWVSAADAAKELGLAESYVVSGAHTGRFPVVRRGRGAWMRREDLEIIATKRSSDRARWMSREEVERLAGCSIATVDRAVGLGEIELRPGPRVIAQRSLGRQSAERWAAEYRARRAAAERRRAAGTAPESTEAPDDEHLWWDTTTAALVVGISENWLRALAAASRVPVTRRGRRMWWRRDLVESFAAARVRASRERSTTGL